jgi:hypothetical protein
VSPDLSGRGNLLPLQEIVSANKVSLAMTEERCHSGPFAPCHFKRSKESHSAQDKLREEYHSAQDRLLEQSKEIATPSVHNDKAEILSMQASFSEGHSTIFYCKKYKWVIPMNLAG